VTNSPLLHANRVSKQFSANRWLFQNLDFVVSANEQLALRGESGVGKSTLLNICAGLEKVDAGEVFYLGQALSQMTETDRLRYRRDSLGFVFQAFHLLPHLTAMQNIMVPSLLSGQTRIQAMHDAKSIAEQLGLTSRLDGFPTELSGGEQQRVAIARALVHQPCLVLADEPTGNLDPSTAKQALETLCSICRSSGAALVMVTHSEQAASMLDRQLILTPQGLSEPLAKSKQNA
jgi:putative ABC transport system ATP-binding protein